MGTNDALGLRSIKEYQKEGMVQVMKDYLKLGWTFDKPIEKFILVVLTFLGLWKFIGFFN